MSVEVGHVQAMFVLLLPCLRQLFRVALDARELLAPAEHLDLHVVHVLLPEPPRRLGFFAASERPRVRPLVTDIAKLVWIPRYGGNCVDSLASIAVGLRNAD